MSISHRKQELLELVPEGLPVTRAYLLEKGGLSVHKTDNLVKSGQLAVLSAGVYARPGTQITWQAIVCSLQNILKTDLTIGGLTALDMQGWAHYLSLNEKKTIHLFGQDALPKWVNKILPQAVFLRHGTKYLHRSLLNHAYDPVQDETYLHDPLRGFTNEFSWRENFWPLTVSSPERALLEVLTDVPDTVSFEHADQLMQGLNTLSPRRVQKLLEACRSVKVNRLFLWLAERNRHDWLKYLEPGKIMLGSGKRVIARHGKLDQKYQITVPEEMWTKTASITDKSSF